MQMRTRLQSLTSLPRPDPDNTTPAFAKTKRERDEVAVARDQALPVDPGVAEHIDRGDREFDVRNVLVCRALGSKRVVIPPLRAHQAGV